MAMDSLIVAVRNALASRLLREAELDLTLIEFSVHVLQEIEGDPVFERRAAERLGVAEIGLELGVAHQTEAAHHVERHAFALDQRSEIALGDGDHGVGRRYIARHRIALRDVDRGARDGVVAARNKQEDRAGDRERNPERDEGDPSPAQEDLQDLCQRHR
jgi:uncharacterized protein (DUF1499 family)